MFKVYHYAMLTETERNRLNGPDGGWDSEPRFSRYADITSFGKKDAVIKGLLEGEYHAVAVVKFNNMEDVFRFTNHIEDDWTKNPAVTAIPCKGYRSTSVGDLIENCETGEIFIVAGCGFEPLAA